MEVVELGPEYELRQSMKSLERYLTDASAIQVVDLLTEREVEELRSIAARPDGDRFSVGSTDEKPMDGLFGMYQQLADSGFMYGFLTNDGTFHVNGLTPKASWAIERFDQRKAEKERKRKLEGRRLWLDRIWNLATTLAGVIVGFLLSRLVGGF